MSEKNVIPESINTALNNLLYPSSKIVGETIGNIFSMVFGSFNYFSEKVDYKRRQKYELLKKECDNKLKNIPEENLVIPNEQIIGQALENSKFCLDEEVLRNMFSSLIANSVNSNFATKVHPSFSTIISQMSPLDAQILIQLKDINEIPCVKYIIYNNDDSYCVIHNNVFNPYIIGKDLYLYSSAIDSLCRLGLISVNYSTCIKIDGIYDIFINSESFDLIKKTLCKPSELKSANGSSPVSADIVRGSLSLTDFGKNFLDVCYN